MDKGNEAWQNQEMHFVFYPGGGRIYEYQQRIVCICPPHDPVGYNLTDNLNADGSLPMKDWRANAN